MDTQISFFPKDWLFSNFKEAIAFAANKEVNFFRLYFNTILVGLLTTAGTLLTTILAAFAFARLNFKGKEEMIGQIIDVNIVEEHTWYLEGEI